MGVQMVLDQNTGVQEGIGSSRVDQRSNGDGRLADDEEVNTKCKVTRGGIGKGGGERESTAQPGPYWLGGAFFGRGGSAN